VPPRTQATRELERLERGRRLGDADVDRFVEHAADARVVEEEAEESRARVPRRVALDRVVEAGVRAGLGRHAAVVDEGAGRGARAAPPALPEVPHQSVADPLARRRVDRALELLVARDGERDEVDAEPAHIVVDDVAEPESARVAGGPLGRDSRDRGRTTRDGRAGARRPILRRRGARARAG
jgi:hypothetical protein